MKFIVVIFIILILPLYTLSQDTLLLSGVNGWQLYRVRPLPINIFDTLNTGMKILPYEEGSTDSVQLFRMYANTRKIVEDWGVEFEWKRYVLTQPQYDLPYKTHINLNVAETVEADYINFGITLFDTTGMGFSSSRYDWIEIQPGWQTKEMFWDNSLVTNVHHIELTFILWGNDSSYIGADILVDSLIFFDENNNATIVDNFGGEIPNSLESFSYLMPTRTILHQNFPNPFNYSTKIKYETPDYSFVKLSVYNFLGEEISILTNEYLNSGTYEIYFDGNNFPTGIYFYRIQTDNFIETKKFILLK